MTEKVGRPREFRNNSERQKAYRERKKALDVDVYHGLELLNDVKSKVEALRNNIVFHKKKGKRIEIRSYSTIHKLMAGGQWEANIEDTTFKYLQLTGQISFVRHHFGESVYMIVENEQ